MRMNRRSLALAFTVLTAMLLLLTRYLGRPDARPLALIAPAPSADALLKVKLAGHKATVSSGSGDAGAQRESRGAGLREKGEALGGRAPDRVETSTITAR